MTRKLHKSKQLEITLQIKDEDFIRPPRDAQRNALLNQALKEFVGNLKALNQHAARFVPGDTETELTDRTQSAVSDDQIMEDWQIPLMQAMAKVVTESGDDVLEIGFGRSSYIRPH